MVRSFEGRASNHVCRVTHARACSEGRDGTVGGHSLWHMVHVDVHHVSAMREVTRRREGEEVEGETTRATKPDPYVCYLHTPLARYGPPPRPPACPATFSRIILRSRRVIIGSVESSCRWTRANAGFGENHGNAGEIGRTFPWFGREDGTPREWGGFVAMHVPWWARGNLWNFEAGAKFWPFRSVSGAGVKHRSTTSERRR